MADYVTLVGLDGTSVSVNPEEVAALTPVPAALLPTGVPAGTYVNAEDNSRVAVQGTVAATVIALAAGSTGPAMTAVIDGATGALLASEGGITGSVRNGVGDYTITHTALPATDQPSVAGSNDVAAPHIMNSRRLGPTTIGVLVFNAGGVPADPTEFSLIVTPIP